MALTAFQRTVCRLIARQRIEQGTSYVAGGVALNALTGGRRVSKDIALFHDSNAAVRVAWEADRRLLEAEGKLFVGDSERLAVALEERRIHFHEGSLHGALPQIKTSN